MAVVHPNKEFISRMALHFPIRSKVMQNFKKELYQQDDEFVQDTKQDFKKTRHNIQAMKDTLQRSNTLPPKAIQGFTLRNGFTGTSASAAQQNDLLNFTTIGQNDFDA